MTKDLTVKSTETKTTATPALPAPAAKPSKKQVLIDLLHTKNGATLQQLMDATGWQQHSVRGALANLKKKDNLQVESERRSDARYFFIQTPAPKAQEADNA